MASKSKSEVVEETVVTETVVTEAEVTEAEVTETEATETKPEVKAEEKVELEPVAIPEGTVKTLAIDKFTADLSVMSGYIGFEPALAKVIEVHSGEILVVATPKDAPPERLYVTLENRAFIEAALASRPSNRGLFAEAVLNMAKVGREGEDYKAAYAAYVKLQGQVESARNLMWELTEAAVAPFEAELFIDKYSFAEVRPVPQAVTPAASSSGRKGKSKVKWNLPTYLKTVDGQVMSLNNEVSEWEGKAWSWNVKDSAGAIVAAGESATDAAKCFMRVRGLSDQISAPREWNAVEQEEAAAEGRTYEV